jgi:quercetin 2,3-dioxygenase
MSNLAPTAAAEPCASEPASRPTLEALPGRVTDVGGLPLRRLLPRSRRRLVGPWCFLDSYGPLSFSSGRPMDVAPHPHMGLQTVSWLLEGEVLHHDSLGSTGTASPGVLNLMTAGRGIAHSEQTPQENGGRLRGVQLWIALPYARRETDPAFEQHDVPVVEVDGGRARVFMGRLGQTVAPARAFSAIVGAHLSPHPGQQMVLPLDADFEHALVLLGGGGRLEGQGLAVDTLCYLGCGRRELVLTAEAGGAEGLLLGGPPFGETVLMWWNSVGRTADEIVAAREDWRTGRRFGEVKDHAGERLDPPPFMARPVPRA